MRWLLDEYPVLPEPPPVAGTIDGGVLGPARPGGAGGEP